MLVKPLWLSHSRIQGFNDSTVIAGGEKTAGASWWPCVVVSQHWAVSVMKRQGGFCWSWALYGLPKESSTGPLWPPHSLGGSRGCRRCHSTALPAAVLTQQLLGAPEESPALVWGRLQAQHSGHLVTAGSPADGGTCYQLKPSMPCDSVQAANRFQQTDHVPCATQLREPKKWEKTNLWFILCLYDLIQILADLDFVVYQTPKKKVFFKKRKKCIWLAVLGFFFNF